VGFVCRLRMGVGLCAVLAAAWGGALAPAAARAQGEAWWHLGVTSTPTVLTPGSETRIIVDAANIGNEPTVEGFAPVTIGLSVPAWITPTAIEGVAGQTLYHAKKPHGGLLGEMSCAALPALSCTYAPSLPPFGTLEVIVTGTVSEHAPMLGSGEARVEGAGTRAVSAAHTFTTGLSTPFDVERSELIPENEGGTVDVQAGSHPYQLTSTIGVNEKATPGTLRPVGPELAKDLRVKLPPGLVGDANAIPQCTDTEFTSLVEGAFNLCPADTAVGGALITVNEPLHLFYTTKPVPIFNLTPEQGEPARFGLDFSGLPVVLNTSVRTGEDYGVTVSASNLTELGSLVGSTLVFWGVPGEASHAASRGSSCITGDIYAREFGAPTEACDLSESSPVALLTLPSSCSGVFQSSAELDSWERPGAYTEPVVSSLMGATGEPVGLSGCNQVGLGSSISVAPDHGTASTPSGFGVDVHVNQEQALTPYGIAPSDVKSISVTLPAGVVANPSVANGLSACSLEEIGLSSALEASCPESSKIGVAEVVSPLLNHVLRGSVYVAAQNANPFGSLLALYLVVKDPISGVLLKLAGKVSPDPVSGQLTATFEDLPQLPFEDATINTLDGQRAALSTPGLCGAYETVGSLVPWSGEGAAGVSSVFDVSSGAGGSGCVASEPFAAGLVSGTSDIHGGSFAPLATSVTHPDGDQPLGGVSLSLPQGLEADISSVPLCAEPAAAEGACSQASLIGHVSVQAGLGTEPVTVEGGEVFLTGPYDGAPFGLSVVTTAKAGPFDLGVVVVRAAVSINPTTAAVSVVTGAIPTILQGIPLQIKVVKVAVDRSGVTVNPTNCRAQAITGSVVSAGASPESVPVSSPFQVANCATLAYKPKFSFSTTASYSKKLGADLHVKLSFPKAPFGSQANTAKVKVDLPIQLPSRQSTFKYACPAATFMANPTDCPPHSIVGQATAVSPLLPVPLAGHAYLVSHAGESIPNVVMVLQGYGVTVDLAGTTQIKKNVTSNTFSAVPDVPVSSFEVTFGQSKYSLFAGYENFCTTTLKSPVSLVAQNGAEIHETDTFAVTGCPKHKPSKTSKKGKK
jgi:hypothetical protein